MVRISMTSRRQYLSQAELVEYAEIQITDATEADDRISKAEEIIDAFVGPQKQFLPRASWDIQGLVSAIVGNSNNQFKLEARHQNVYQQNYFTFCWLEIQGGAGIGQRHKIVQSLYDGTITIEDTFSPVIDTTSFYRIWQLGHFPRQLDVYFDAIHTPIQYYKHIPEEIRRATAAQVEYMIEQGDDFFAGDDVFKNAERMGNYQYQKDRQGSGTGIDQLIAPKAKWLLRGYKNRRGSMII